MAAKQYPNGLEEAVNKARLIDPDLGPTKLARLIGSTKQTISRYIDGDRKLPLPIAKKLAPILKVSAKELIFDEPDAPGLVRVPLLSWVSAGKLEGGHNVDAKKTVPVADLPKGDWIALEVKGDSMDRVAPEGSTIFVDRSDDRLKDDLFYVFGIGSGEATFKRYRGGRQIRLQPFSTNPDHETLPAPEDIRVIGRVRRVVTDLR